MFTTCGLSQTFFLCDLVLRLHCFLVLILMTIFSHGLKPSVWTSCFDFWPCSVCTLKQMLADLLHLSFSFSYQIWSVLFLGKKYISKIIFQISNLFLIVFFKSMKNVHCRLEKFNSHRSENFVLIWKLLWVHTLATFFEERHKSFALHKEINYISLG